MQGTATAQTQATANAQVQATANAQVQAQATADAWTQASVMQRLTHQPVQPSYIFYTVRPGDTVESIARRFHDVAWLIRRRNGGLWTMAPGQQIRVWQWPFGAPYHVIVRTMTDTPRYYTVRTGDTLSAIAAALHSDVGTLAGENNLGASDLIYSGQSLVLHHYTVRLRGALVPGVPASALHTGLLLTDVSNLVGIDAALVKGLVYHETGWQMVRGASGEIGMVQIMPYMANWVERALIGYHVDPNVPVYNALEGTLLLAYYLDETNRDAHKSLALYHSGDTFSNERNGIYIRTIESLRDYFYHHPQAGF